MCKTHPTIAPIYLVLQQGGSSGEWYATTYDTKKAAKAAVASHRRATYTSAGPFKLPAGLTPVQEAALLNTFERAAAELLGSC